MSPPASSKGKDSRKKEQKRPKGAVTVHWFAERLTLTLRWKDSRVSGCQRGLRSLSSLPRLTSISMLNYSRESSHNSRYRYRGNAREGSRRFFPRQQTIVKQKDEFGAVFQVWLVSKGTRSLDTRHNPDITLYFVC
jgi:hypothetical protein